jgi:hypothetical protein
MPAAARLSSLALALAIWVGVSGCGLHGPAHTRSSHLAYNEAVQASEQQELLLNIVRLRYLDAPEFLAVTSISTQLQVEAQASVLGLLGKADGESVSTAAPGASVGYSESPVVTFSPRRDEAFVRQLVAPAAIDSLYLLTRYGWGIERVLMLTAESINGLQNDAPREASSDTHARSMSRFLALCRTLEALDAADLVEIERSDTWEAVSAALPAGEVDADAVLAAAGSGYRFAPAGENAVVLSRAMQRYVLRVHEEATGSEHLAELQRLANLRTRQPSFAIEPVTTDTPPDLSFVIRTRSVLGAMAWLSRGVAVPHAHLESGMAAPDDELSSLIREWLSVRQAAEQPAGAWLAVPYRGYWFYIGGGDLESKRTLGLLSSLVRLEIGAGGSQNVPVLTLPVSR